MKEKILALADDHPEVLGFRGAVAFLTVPYLPENYDLDGATLECVLDLFPEEHLAFIYEQLKERTS